MTYTREAHRFGCEECAGSEPCWIVRTLRGVKVELVSWVTHGCGWWKVTIVAPTQWQIAALYGPKKAATTPPAKWSKMATTDALIWELKVA